MLLFTFLISHKEVHCKRASRKVKNEYLFFRELSVLKERASVNEVEKMKVIKEMRDLDEDLEASEKQNNREIQAVEEQYAKTMNAVTTFNIVH